MRWLTDLFNKILRIRKILSKWKRCSLVHIYIGTEDIQNCTNYCGIKLESHHEISGVVGRRLRHQKLILDNQFGLSVREV